MKSILAAIVLFVFVMIGLPLQTQAAGDMVSYARVMDDGSLIVKGRTIWLYGIYIPSTDRTCRTYEFPVRCGPRAILALDFKIEPHFVDCEVQWENDDGSITALCKVKGEDLSAWMLQSGWAAALPDAPFAYQLLEKIARTKGQGIWGTIIDRR